MTVGAARSVTPPEWTSHRVPRGPGSESAWKYAVRDAVADAELIPAGPVGLQISLTVGPRRSWTALWKRTIDGLDAVLGRTYADRDWNPQDGRIVRLGLHVRTDHTLGHEVEATIWARPADMTWPELRWLASMDEAERSAYVAGHHATLHPAPRPRARSAGPPERALSGSAQPRPRGRPPGSIPVGLTELTTETEFDNAVAAGHVMLKTDTAGPPKIHIRPARCSGVTSEHFRTAVIIGGGRNARYFTLTDPVAARQRWPRVAVCGVCKRLDPEAAGAIEAVIAASEDPRK